MPPKKNSNPNANGTAAPAERYAGDTRLRTQLLDQLMDLPFAALMACVRDLLAAEGYANVRLSGRIGYRGRNREGGYDLEAFLPSQTGGGVLRRKVLVQVKQFEPETRVYQRTLDALRGACLRAGAIEGVLITTSDFSPVVRNAEANLRRHGGDAVAPVHLLNGDSLAIRLIRHGIGVRPSANGTAAFDRAYFESLQTGDTGAGDTPRSVRSTKGFPQGAQVSISPDCVTLTLPLTLFSRS